MDDSYGKFQTLYNFHSFNQFLRWRRCRGGGWGGEEEEAGVEEKAEKEAEEDAEADEKVEVLCSSSSHKQIHIISSSPELFFEGGGREYIIIK